MEFQPDLNNLAEFFCPSYMMSSNTDAVVQFAKIIATWRIGELLPKNPDCYRRRNGNSLAKSVHMGTCSTLGS
jgi:hypothetical protein